MKSTKLLFIVLVALLCYNSCKKEDPINAVLGTYYAEGICKDLMYGFSSSFECEITIKKGTKSDLLIDDFLEAFLIGDSLFIPIQLFEVYDGKTESLNGKGRFINDSIFLHTESGGPSGLFEYDYKGKRIK